MSELMKVKQVLTFSRDFNSSLRIRLRTLPPLDLVEGTDPNILDLSTTYMGQEDAFIKELRELLKEAYAKGFDAGMRENDL